MAAKASITHLKKGALIISLATALTGSLYADDAPAASSLLSNLQNALNSAESKTSDYLVDAALNLGSLAAIQWTSNMLFKGLRNAPGADYVVKQVSDLEQKLPQNALVSQVKQLTPEALALAGNYAQMKASSKLANRLGRNPLPEEANEALVATALAGAKYLPVVGDALPKVSTENSGYYAKGISLVLSLARSVMNR